MATVHSDYNKVEPIEKGEAASPLSEPKSSKELDSEIIKDCREFMTHSVDFDGDNRSAAVDDLLFGAGEQWPADIKTARKLDNRPCLTNNVLPTYLRQVTGDQRQNKGGIKVHAVDDDADPETAEIEQGLIRHIEYDSNADVAYDTAVNGAASNGFGYFRLVTEYEAPDSFDQCIKFKRIRNPLTVYFDPGSEQPDGSDQTKCAISTKIKKEDYKRQYPKADMAGFDALKGIGDWADWCDDLFVRVAEFYRIEHEDATLVMLSNGETGWKDKLIELPAGVQIIKERSGSRKRVCWYKLSAVEVLERTEIKCEWIPVFPVFGDEVDIEGKVIRSGLIRYAKDPMKMYNFWMTCATEEVALRPKAPFIGAEGQFEGNEDTWKQANNRSFAYLEYKMVELEGKLAPAPQRQQMTDIPSGMLAMAMHAYENIQKTIGIYNAGLGAKSNETSGKAILARQREGDVGTFHFTDNLNISRKHAGRCILSMLPHYYDTPRAVRILGEDGTPSQVTLNEPNRARKPSKDGKVREVLNNVMVGRYDVTVSSGPSYTTLRQEAAESMVQLTQAAPQLLDIAGDQMIRNMDWPGAQETADRMKRYINMKMPGVIEQDEGDEEMIQTPKGPIPKSQAGAAIAGMDQTITMMEQTLQKAKVQDIDNKAHELAIKDKDAETKKYEAETARMVADATLIKAGAEAKAADENLVMVAQSAAREAVSLVGQLQAAPPINPQPTPGEPPLPDPAQQAQPEAAVI